MSEEAEKDHSAATMQRPLFRPINAEDFDPEITELESLCINCEEQGTTRLFLTKIPFFRQVVIASFSCDHCAYSNAELQPAGDIQDRGVMYKLTVKTVKDLNRQVVQTASSTIKIPKLEFEVPPSKSMVTTIEGVIDSAVQGLESDQVLRKIQHPELAVQIDEFIVKLKALKTVSEPFQFIVDDISGNSFLENPLAPNKDYNMVVAHYARTRAQDMTLGLINELQEEEEEDARQAAVGQDDGEGLNTQNEVMEFRTNCPDCNSPCDTKMKLVNIPHFKDVVIMATDCELCGHKTNEVKSAGGISEKGCKMELTIKNREDIARDVLKSETASLSLPDLDFETEMGTLGGKFTTVEGLLENVKTQLKATNPFFHGDSSQPSIHGKLREFCVKVDDIITGKLTDIKFVLDDPAGNSYIQSLTAPDPDSQLVITAYERSYDQNEELGLNDMKTEDYDEM